MPSRTATEVAMLELEQATRVRRAAEEIKDQATPATTTAKVEKKRLKKAGMDLRIVRGADGIIRFTVRTDPLLEDAFRAAAGEGTVPIDRRGGVSQGTAWNVPHAFSDVYLGSAMFVCGSSEADTDGKSVLIEKPRSYKQVVRHANQVREFLSHFQSQWLDPFEITVTVKAKAKPRPECTDRTRGRF